MRLLGGDNMGLFDNLVKSVSELANTEEAKKLKDNLKNFAQSVDTSSSSNRSSSSSKSIPEEYSHFPVFNGKIDDLTTKNEEKYKRCSINYNNVNDADVEAYIKTIEEAGYEKKTDVRYEKNNEYIIVDRNTYVDLNIVYHVKF